MKTNKKLVAVLDDDPDAIFIWRREANKNKKIDLIEFNLVEPALEHVKRKKVDLFLTDFHLPYYRDGSHIKQLKSLMGERFVICYSLSKEITVELMAYENGADYFFSLKDSVVDEISQFNCVLGKWLKL